ncbi:sulfite exporter TauE/SafE family protein [Pseudomonadota bacterium]
MNDYLVPILSLIIFVAFFVRAFTGFGAALISVPLLALFYDLKFVVPLELIFETAIGVLLIAKVYKEINFKHLWNLLVGLLLGSILGAHLLANTPNRGLQIGLGFTVLILSLYMVRFAKRPIVWKISANWGILFGLLAGTLGGAFNMSGPITVLYLSHQAIDKTQFRATLIGLFFITEIWKTVLFTYNGLFVPEMLEMTLKLAPAFLAGTILGHLSHIKVSDKNFRYTLAAVLFVAGFFLLSKLFN